MTPHLILTSQLTTHRSTIHMTTNGIAELDEAEELSFFDEIIEKIRLIENTKLKISDEENALRAIIRAKHDEERDAIQQCRDLLQLKEELRTDIIRLNDQNERMADQMDTVKALEGEIRALNGVCDEMHTSTEAFSLILAEKQSRIMTLKPQITGQEICIGTDIEGLDTSYDQTLIQLHSNVQKKLETVMGEIEKITSVHDLHSSDELLPLAEEEKTLRKQIRDLKRQLKKDISDHRGVKRSTPSSQRSRKRHSASRLAGTSS